MVRFWFSAGLIAISAVAHAANPVGWASQTGFQGAITPVQKAIVQLAINANGKKSGQSLILSPGAQGCDKQGWCTDTAHGAGARLRSAISAASSWVTQYPNGGELPESVRSKMYSDLSRSYTTKDMQILVQYITDLLLHPPQARIAALPDSDLETLQFLQIQKQSFEWVETTALAGGGNARPFSTAGVADPKQYRPGMGRLEHSRAAIITDIYWDTNANPVKFQIAEANLGAGWASPSGMVPWNRTVTVTNMLAGKDITPGKGVKVIDFEH